MTGSEIVGVAALKKYVARVLEQKIANLVR